ncbi:MAG: PA2169 family four-helix-bundle protein [Terriglobales bacterium]
MGERLQDQTLTRYFFTESLLRAQFIDQLETTLRQRGVSRFREKGSAVAALHRTWARIKSRFMGGDHTLLITAEQGEEAVNEVYIKALETYLPTSIREILSAQEAHIELVHAFVKTERDRLAAGDKTARSTVPVSDEVSH